MQEGVIYLFSLSCLPPPPYVVILEQGEPAGPQEPVVAILFLFYLYSVCFSTLCDTGNWCLVALCAAVI